MARFLVIDDDNTTRELMAATLRRAGHGVDQAASGREAAALFHRQPAEVVITDIVMPDDSLEQVLALRIAFPAVPFIVASGMVSNSPQIRDITRLLDARRWLAKPFSLADLIAAAEGVLAERSGSRALLAKPVKG